MPEALTVILIVLAGAGALSAFAALGVSVYLLRPLRRTPADLEKEELILKQVDPSLYKVPYEEMHIRSESGYDIYARGYLNPQIHKYVVLVHGHNAASSGMVRFSDIFLKRGYNTVLPDNRYSAKTGGKTITYGYYESRDIISVIQEIYRRDPIAQIGIMGESMGGATALIVAGKRRDLKFCIDYCGYADMKDEIVHVVRSLAPPAVILMPLVKGVFRLLAGFSMKEVCPEASAKEIDMPVLVLHSRQDKVVPYAHHERIMKNLRNGRHTAFEESGHGLSLNTYPEQFCGAVNAFLDDIRF